MSDKEIDDLVANLQNEIYAKCGKDTLSEKKVLERLLPKLGYRKSRLTKCNKLKVNLDNALINKLKVKETEIAEQIKEKPKVLCMDLNMARYIIEAALTNFTCIRAGKKLSKKKIDEILGCCDRTMRNQQKNFQDKVLRPSDKIEHRVYTELCNMLNSYSIG